MSFSEDRKALIGAVQFTGRLVEHLISRLSGKDADDFREAWYSETKPQLDELINTLEGRPR